MKNKTCGECKNRYSDEGTCPVKWGVNDTDDARNCDTFEPRTIAYGDLIRQMLDEELAELFVYTKYYGDSPHWFSTIFPNYDEHHYLFNTKQEAIEATIEELKKEVKNG